MPSIYFGFRPRNRGPTKLAVSTPRGDLEPVEPSKIKIFSKTSPSPIWSLMWSVLGLAVSILTYPRYVYTAYVTTGLRPRAAGASLPFRRPGLAVPFIKGSTISETVSQKLESEGFQSMQYQGRLVWLKEEAGRDDFIGISELAKVETSGAVPARFMNPDSFRAYLTLLSVTTRISQLFHRLAQDGKSPIISSIIPRSTLKHGWITAKTADEDPDNVPTVTEQKVEFNKCDLYLLDSPHERIPASIVYLPGASTGTSISNSGCVMNSFDGSLPGFITSGSILSITSAGLIFKFNHQLALPDPNLIGDILGRHFLHCLGDSTSEQFENLQFLKSGLSSLRLTRVGDELTHLFKCFEIAISCNAGCVPFFNGSVYEGTVIMGGPGAEISINGEIASFLPAEILKDEFLTVSSHTAALASIALHFSGREQARVKQVASMVDLREHCLTLEATQDVRDSIIRSASNLEFGVSEWVVNPANLKSAFSLISDLSTLDSEKHPISRLALFSKDPVLVALSCFGEKSCPSLEIPNGIKCSLRGANPPIPPTQITSGGNRRGNISDAAWVMVIRYTDLFSATDEFKRVAANMVYRSIPSAEARKIGHRVFSRERMAEFWRELRVAVRFVNPNAKFETDEEVIGGKRKADEGDGPTGRDGKAKVQRLDF